MSHSVPQQHKAIAIVKANTLGIAELPTRQPQDGEVLINVQYGSYGAFDHHQLADGFFVQGFPQVLGLVGSGKVASIGSGVTNVAAGDQVVSFALPGADRGLQEYIIAPSSRVTKLPPGLSGQDAAAILDNFVTAWFCLKSCLQFPLPETLPSKEPLAASVTSTPILIWGGGTGVAFYAFQILKSLGFTNVITTASPRSGPEAISLGATTVIDYNDKDVAKKIIAAAGGKPVRHALNCVATKASLDEMAKVLVEAGCKAAMLLPIKLNMDSVSGSGGQLLPYLPDDQNPFGKNVEPIMVSTFGYEENASLKANLISNILPELFKSGKLRSQPVVLINEGSLLGSAQKAARLIQEGKLGGGKAIIALA